MEEKVGKVFDLLGVKPNEEFMIYNNNSNRCIDSTSKYIIDEKLQVRCFDNMKNCWVVTLAFSIRHLLMDEITIIKFSELTKDDKNAIKYLRCGGMQYIARDKNGLLYAHKNKPKRDNYSDEWKSNEWVDVFDNLFQFVLWTDEEPFCIINLEV